MTMTDPIADMLTRIRNANVAMHDEVRMPSSRQKVALAKILQQEGYITGYGVGAATTGPGEVLTIQMKYSPERSRTISGLRHPSISPLGYDDPVAWIWHRSIDRHRCPRLTRIISY